MVQQRPKVSRNTCAWKQQISSFKTIIYSSRFSPFISLRKEIMNGEKCAFLERQNEADFHLRTSGVDHGTNPPLDDKDCVHYRFLPPAYNWRRS